MVQQLHDFYLPVDLLQVHSIQLGLVYDLNGHLQDANVSSFFHFCAVCDLLMCKENLSGLLTDI